MSSSSNKPVSPALHPEQALDNREGCALIKHGHVVTIAVVKPVSCCLTAAAPVAGVERLSPLASRLSGDGRFRR
jgi:hypothetical protein